MAPGVGRLELAQLVEDDQTPGPFVARLELLCEPQQSFVVDDVDVARSGQRSGLPRPVD